jgi:hypothetical protein
MSVLIAIGMFDSADEAFASNEKAANWVRNNVLEFTNGMPEISRLAPRVGKRVSPGWDTGRIGVGHGEAQASPSSPPSWLAREPARADRRRILPRRQFDG